MFCTSIGTQLDESKLRKVFNRILDKAGLHRRGPHQMRHTFASLLLQRGEPITHVSRQLGHKDASITLRVYAYWLPDTSGRRGVDRLDDGTSPAESVDIHWTEQRRSAAVNSTLLDPICRTSDPMFRTVLFVTSCVC